MSIPTKPISAITPNILLIRNQKVKLDADLAEIYGVPTKRLNEQVRRNRQRFPEDFMFQLTPTEFHHLKSQIATSSHGGRRSVPFAFTEHGAIMAASVLNTPSAIAASVQVVRAFVELRRALLSHQNTTRKLLEIEERLRDHDEKIATAIQAIHDIMTQPPANAIGFSLNHPEKKST